MARRPTTTVQAAMDLLEALRRRSRALRHKFHIAEWERVAIEQGSGEAASEERVDVFLQRLRSANSLQLRLSFWPDRWTWVDARERAKTGWGREWSFEGRLSGKHSGRDLVEALEKTSSIFATSTIVEQAHLDEIWEPLLLVGPKSDRKG